MRLNRMATTEGQMSKRIVMCAVLFICIIASQNAWAGSGVGLRSLGVDMGFVDPDKVSGTVGFGAFANMGNITPDIRLVPHIGYWSKSEEFFGTKTRVNDISFSTRGQYMFPVSSPKFRPYAGLGVGMHVVGVKVSDPGPPATDVSDSRTKLGMDLGGGFVTMLSQKNDLYVDFWYTAVSDVAQLSMKVGISFDVGGGSSDNPTRHRAPARRTKR